MKKILISIIILLIASHMNAVSISGYISDQENGERIRYASVSIGGTQTGTLSNEEGYFVITSVLHGKIELHISQIAYKPVKEIVMIENEQDDKFLQIELEKTTILMEGIDVVEDKFIREVNTREVIVSNTLQTTKEILDVPQIADSDIFRSIQILPGVSSLSDFSSGFYVRGGTPDQNLILLDEIDVYNPSHFGGIFSTFNTDAIESVELMKGGFPAKYGGRLSSVLNVSNLDGNRKHHEGIARVSLISANSTLQGPWKIGEQKGSYMASFRRTYLELVQKALDLPDYYFYDGHTKLTWDVTEKDKIALSTYFGKDKLSFDFGYDMLIQWGNETFSSQWVHIFNPQIFSRFVLAGSHFNSLFKVKYPSDLVYERTNDIYDGTLKSMFNYIPNDQHLLDFGLEAKYNNVTFKFTVTDSDLDPDKLPDVEVNSSILSAYCQDSWDLDAFWTLQPGIRLTYCHNQSPNLPMSPVGNYFRFSPRLSIRRKITYNSNIYLSYGRYFQYLTSMNPGMATPMDLWFPIDGSVSPGQADHYVFGFKNQIGSNFGLDMEAYYKLYENLVEYRPETDFEWNNQTGSLSDVYNMGDGYSYGIDLLFRTDWNGFEGFVGYGFGITERKIDNMNINPETNEEEPYHPRYERVHQLNVIETYNVSEVTGMKVLGAEFRIGTTYSLGSGQPYFKPEKVFYDDQGTNILYSYNDHIRLPNYSRLDLSFKFKWQFSKWSFEPYIQVINMLKHENVWFRDYTYQENDNGEFVVEDRDANMFPRVPFFGFNIDW